MPALKRKKLELSIVNISWLENPDKFNEITPFAFCDYAFFIRTPGKQKILSVGIILKKKHRNVEKQYSFATPL